LIQVGHTSDLRYCPEEYIQAYLQQKASHAPLKTQPARKWQGILQYHIYNTRRISLIKIRHIFCQSSVVTFGPMIFANQNGTLSLAACFEQPWCLSPGMPHRMI